MFSRHWKAHWTPPTVRVVVYLIVAGIVLLTVSGQALADPKCQTARGRLMVQFPFPPDQCPAPLPDVPPLGQAPLACARGTLTGRLAGPFNVNVHTIIPIPVPTAVPEEVREIVFFIGDFVLSRKAGDVYITLTGEIDSPRRGGNFTQIMTLSGGTGDNEEARGQILARGGLLPDSEDMYLADYEGEVCDVR
jgi:hypothetical protein